MQTEQDLEQLVRAYTPALLRYCTGILGNEHDAQDAVQKTFIKAWQRRYTLRDRENNTRAWLYRIAYRTALARIHGVPAPYLRTRYSRAKAKLAAILQEGEHDDL